MLETVNIGRWTLDVDREETESAFAKIPLGAPEGCGCDYCKNLVVARDQAYPPEAKEMLAKLGIDYRKEAETWEWTRLQDGRHSYGGFFHFIGKISGGADAVQWESVSGTTRSGTFHLERVGEEFEFGFTNDVALLEEPFKGQQVVQMEFAMPVPWLIDLPDPDLEDVPQKERSDDGLAEEPTFLTKIRKFFTKT